MTPMRHRRRIAAVGLALATAAALALSACSSGGSGTDGASGDAGKPVKGGNLTVGILGDPGGLDQNVAPSVEASNISQLIFERLFTFDKDNKARPMLVDHYTRSDDRLTYDFTLRKGVEFSDGKPLTADDAIESLKYWERINDTGKKIAADTASLEKTGDLSFRIVLKSPRYPFLQELAGVGTAVLEADLAKGLTSKGFTPKQAIGTGPYKLKTYETNDKVVLERNPKFTSRTDKHSGYAGEKHAYLDTITFKILNDQDALVNGLKTDQWQYTMDVPVDHYEEFKNDPSYVTHTLEGGNLNMLVLNNWSMSIFHDQKARDAFNMAIDKKAINAAAGGSPDVTVNSGALVNKDRKILHSDAGEKEYNAHNPKKAKKLFEEAGYTDAKPIRILTEGAATNMQWATMIQSQLAKIGVKVKIQPYDFVTMLGVWDEHPEQWDIIPIFFNGDFPSPGQMNQLQSDHADASATHPELPDTRSEKMRSLLSDYLLATSDEQAHQVMTDITAEFWKNKRDVILSMTKPFAVYSPKLKGYDDYWYAFANAWLAK